MKKILYSIFSLLLIAFLLTSCYVNDFSDIEQNGESENTELDIEKEVEQLQQRVEVFEKDITPLAQKCDNASQMQAYIDQIKAMPQVKDAWVENDVFCLKDESGMLHVWDYQTTDLITEEDNEAEVREMKALLETRSAEADKSVGQGKRVCLIFGEKNYQWEVNSYYLLKLFGYYRFDEVVSIEKEKFSPDYLLSPDFINYDVYFIRTHGAYFDGQHWLLTNTHTYNRTTIANLLNKYIENQLGQIYKSGLETLIADKIAIMHLHYGTATKDGGTYYTISDSFFSDLVFSTNGAVTRTFTKNNPIIFNSSCLTMAENKDLAKIFVEKGKAGAYLGYKISQAYGNFAGMEIYRLMLENHYTLEGAIRALNYQYGRDDQDKCFYVLDKELDYVIRKEGLSLNPPKAVDMGGKVKWSSCNIGADSEYELGDSLRWGEVRPWYSWLHSFDKGRYKRYDSGLHYDTDLDYTYVGVQIVDIGGLEKYDPATRYFGDGWRLPTKEDFEDLLYSGINKVETITETSPNYLLVTNKVNGNQILLPYPDFEWTFSSFVCHYWTSEAYECIDENGNNEKEAWALLPVGIPPFYETLMSDCPGYLAGFVRPVYTK